MTITKARGKASAPLSDQGSASALQARARLSQLLCSEGREHRDDPIGELFRSGAAAKMGIEAFAVYAYLLSRYSSEHPTTKDISSATGMKEIDVKSALQTLLHFGLQGADLDRSVGIRVHEITKQCLERTEQTL